MNEKIAESALQEFLTHGIRDITIAKLIAPLSISTKTFYKYYDSKETLLKECLYVLYDRTYEDLGRIANSEADPVTKLIVIFTKAFDKDFGKNHAFYHDLNHYYPALQNEAIHHIATKSGALMVPLIKQGIKDGYFLASLDPLVALQGINTLYTSITRGQDFQNSSVSPELLFKNLIEIFIRGMCTIKGQKKIKNFSNNL